MIIKPNLHSLIFIAGPSGAGKSTLTKVLKTQMVQQLHVDGYPPNVQIVSSDETRRELLNYEHHRHDPLMLQVSKQAFGLMADKIERLMQWPVSAQYIIVDATNLSAENRKPFLDLCKKYHYMAEVIVLDYKSNEEYEKFLPKDFSREILFKGIRNLRQIFYPNLSRKDFSNIYKVREKTKGFANIKVEIPKLSLWKKTFLDPNTRDIHIISDIHGCFTEFKAALQKIGYGVKDNNLIVPDIKKDDVIILLGDFIDKGPENKEIVDFIHKNLSKFVVVIGNHENFIVKWFQGRVKPGDIENDIVENYFTCAVEFKDDEDWKKKFFAIVEASLPFVRSHRMFANHAPCEAKYFGKLDKVSLKAQRNFRIPRANAVKGKDVINLTKKVWETGLDFWSKQAERSFPFHFVGHLPLQKVCRIKNQFIIDGGLPNGGSLVTVSLKQKDRPFFTYTPKQTPTKQVEKLFTIFDEDPRFFIKSLDLDDAGKKRLAYAAKEKINFISGTMAPVDKEEDCLESLQQGLIYYRKAGVKKVVLQHKYMGSRCNLYLNSDIERCYAASRGGHKIRIDMRPIFEQQLGLLGDYLKENKIKWMIIDGELLPWHALGKSLIERTFVPIEHAIESEHKILTETGFEQRLQEVCAAMDASDFKADKSKMKKQELANKYGHHVYGTYKALSRYKHIPLKDLEPAVAIYKKQLELYGREAQPYFKGFAVLKEIYEGGGEKTFFDKKNIEVYRLTGNTDPCLEVDLDNEQDLIAARGFYDDASRQDLEGVVIKPEYVYVPKVAPFLKARNPNYLSIVYGYDYQTEEKLKKLLKQKSVRKKIKTSIAEFKIGKAMLEIPRSEISAENTDYANLIAQMILEETAEKEIDPRL